MGSDGWARDPGSPYPTYRRDFGSVTVEAVHFKWIGHSSWSARLTGEAIDIAGQGAGRDAAVRDLKEKLKAHISRLQEAVDAMEEDDEP